MAGLEMFCPSCGSTAEERGRPKSATAPPDWYRCPECFHALPLHEMPKRKRVNLLATGSPPLPGYAFVGTAQSTNPADGASISTQPIHAKPGDQLIAQVLGRTDGGVDATVSVSWGSATISMLPIAFAYVLLSGDSYGRTMRHTVVSAQTAPMVFNFSGAIPDKRLINVIRLSRITPPTSEPFDDDEDRFGYPYQVPPITFLNANYNVICHGQHAPAGLPPVVWDTVQYVCRTEVDGLTNNILTSTMLMSSTVNVHATSGPDVNHGTGFFGLRAS